MMHSVNIREARKNLSRLVDAAAQGQSVLITRNGKEVAQLGPAATHKRKPLPDLSEFRKSLEKSVRRKGKPLSKIVIEGRRQARY